MSRLADFLESLILPLLTFLDRSGLVGELRFAPLSRLIAALSVIVLASYALSVVLAPLEERVRALRRVRVIGRVVAIAMAVYVTASVVSNATFAIEHGGLGSAAVRSGLGLVLVLGLMLFLDVRLARRRDRS